MGLVLQWSFILPQIAQSCSTTTNGTTSGSGSCDTNDEVSIDPYLGPECCVTLPANTPEDLDWPRRTKWTIPTVFAELFLGSGSSMSDDDLDSLKGKISDTIASFFCHKGQKVW